MKGLNLFLATCFIAPVLTGAVADTAKNTTRTQYTKTQNTVTTTRNNNSNKPRANAIPRNTSSKNVVQRNATTTKNRTVTQSREASGIARTAKKQNILSRQPNKTSKTQKYSGGLSRSATVQTRESVMQRNFSKCKSVFFECMDEFCANKDAQLKRCACSTRSNEFRTTQKSLDNVEDKLLDFSQRLLQVNMDPADAAVIHQETEGERAYNATKDTTESKKTLDDIANKLNTKFDSATTETMSALTWSLDVDSAFDSVDSLTGVSTTAKSGNALRNAALPVCREMAAEVCNEDDITLVVNSYNMAIEQDCNTVQRAYSTQTQQAKNKILESSALLDMTRLNTYQENNSDDILTCKSKMLEKLTNTNVCGTDLTKCLDISGRYINPTTGEAFLSASLVNLANLIVRPTGSNTWANNPANSSFVSYLNSKKTYIEPATKNCQAIADDVWNIFIEDALAQIKLAQNAKLETIRQSCTTLLTECLDSAKQNLSDFDSRALSTFGVMTDKTTNALCDDVKSSCSAIIESDLSNTTANNGTTETWTQGVTNIAARQTYETIINTCREVGRSCMINSCKSISGNFGLCESIHGSVNRHSILTRAACWDDVYNCVAQASDESIIQIHNILHSDALPNNGTVPRTLYNIRYHGDANYTPTDPNENVDIWDICRAGTGACGTGAANDPDPENTTCYKCRITEQIWGNCQKKPDNRNENKILIPFESDTTTLLSWFATNTHTQSNDDSCATSICPAGSLDYTIGTSTICVEPENIVQCDIDNILCVDRIDVTSQPQIRNCCPSGLNDNWGNCCLDAQSASNNESFSNLLDNTITQSTSLCTTNTSISTMNLVAKYTANNATTYVLCAGTVTNDTSNNYNIICDGEYVMLECANSKCYYKKPGADANTPNYNVNYFIDVNVGTYNQNYPNWNYTETNAPAYCAAVEQGGSNKCTYTDMTNGWSCTTTPTKWLVDF